LTTFDTTIILQRKRVIDTKIKTIERENNMSMKKKVVKNGCINIISLINYRQHMYVIKKRRVYFRKVKK